MVAGDEQRPAGDERQVSTPQVAYLFTRFPYLTETFLQREVAAMVSLGLKPALYSFHGGGGEYCGIRVQRLSKWRLLRLFWLIPGEIWRNPEILIGFARRLFLEWPRDWINHWENLYGAGIAVVLAGEFRKRNYDHLHAAWASCPAMAAWVLSRITNATFSFGAHAYDLFEYGGDWLLKEKARDAVFVHTSTRTGFRRLVEIGVPADKVLLARRGLLEFPECRPLRRDRRVLRITCIARLVRKKGLLRQVRLYAVLRHLGLELSVRILGEGPLREKLANEIRSAGLQDVIKLLGAVSPQRVWAELAEADVLVHSGEVTRSGDRDGLPNVVPEAMAAGVIVFTTPGEGVREAVEHEVTGVVRAIDDVEGWAEDLARIRDDDEFAANLSGNARRWVEENFDARRNAELLLERYRQAKMAAVPVTESVEASLQLPEDDIL